MIEVLGRLIRRHRWKALVIAVLLLLFAFYQSFLLAPPEQQLNLDFIRNDDMDVVMLRLSGSLFMVIAVVGFISKINRDLFPDRYKKTDKDSSDRNKKP